jgi:hypothetical protein
MIEPTVEAVSHAFLGPMRRLTLAPGLVFDLLPLEAATLSRAMSAVCADPGRVPEIYLSPNGCDREFHARVTDAGLLVADDGGALLVDWPAVARLAVALPGEG